MSLCGSKAEIHLRSYAADLAALDLSFPPLMIMVAMLIPAPVIALFPVFMSIIVSAIPLVVGL